MDYDIHGEKDEQELSGSLNCDAPDGQENVEETTETCGQCTRNTAWSESFIIRGEDGNGGWTDECGVDAHNTIQTTTTTATMNCQTNGMGKSIAGDTVRVTALAAAVGQAGLCRTIP
jgi:hypothetical protein